MGTTAELEISLNLLGIESILPGSMQAYTAAAVLAEAAGIDGIVMPDHVVMGDDASDYPFHRWESPPEMYWPEPMVVLAAVAGATRSLRLATSILISPLRPAVLVAKQAASLDSISGGRLSLGVGVGWQRAEYAACAVDFSQRRQILEDQLGAWTKLWSGCLVSHDSPTLSFANVCCQPPPHDSRAIPLWLGLAPTAANAATMARFGTGWAALKPDPDFIARGARIIRDALHDAGAPPAKLLIRTSPRIAYTSAGDVDWDAVRSGVQQLAQAGVTHFDFPVSFMSANEVQFRTLIDNAAGMKRCMD